MKVVPCAVRGEYQNSHNGGVGEISCLEVLRELSSYIDKDLTSELRAQITAHLPTCEQCTAIFVNADPRLAPLRMEPLFSQVLRKVGPSGNN